MSDTGTEDSPATPKSSAMQWPPQSLSIMNHHPHHLHRAASFADFGQQMGGYSLQQQFNHRHSLSSGGAHEYHGGHPHHHTQAPIHEHPQAQQQHPVHMLQRTASLPQHSFFVTEQNNPGVATMNTNAHPTAAAASMHHTQYQQIPRQSVERLPLEIPYTSTAPGLTAGSIQSSPSSFSAASGRSPSTQDGFYTHHANTAQAATYALHTASPVDQQQQQPPQMVAAAFQGHTMTTPTPRQQQATVVEQQYHHQQQVHSHATAPQPPQPEVVQQNWYDSVPYQPPVEVATIGQLPGYASGVYDPWGAKIEFEDTSMQLPSARIENM